MAFAPEYHFWESIWRKNPENKKGYGYPDMSLAGEFTNGVEERQHTEVGGGSLTAWTAAGEKGGQD